MKKKETKSTVAKKKGVKKTTKKVAEAKPRRRRVNYSPRISKKMAYLFVGLLIALLVMVGCICVSKYNEAHKKPSLDGSNGIKEVDAPKDECDDGKYHPDTVK